MDNVAQRSPLLRLSSFKFRGLRGKIRRNPRPLVSYLGCVKILRPLDLEMCGSVVEIYENANKGRKSHALPTFEVEFCDCNESLCLVPVSSKGETLAFKLHRIICCGADSKKRKIFVLNYHGTSSGQEGLPFQTHALLCDSENTAKLLAVQVGEFFRRQQLQTTE